MNNSSPDSGLPPREPIAPGLPAPAKRLSGKTRLLLACLDLATILAGGAFFLVIVPILIGNHESVAPEGAGAQPSQQVELRPVR